MNEGATPARESLQCQRRTPRHRAGPAAGVSILQYLDGVPDRGAVELLRYHSGWNFALNRQLGDELFHPQALDSAERMGTRAGSRAEPARIGGSGGKLSEGFR